MRLTRRKILGSFAALAPLAAYGSEAPLRRLGAVRTVTFAGGDIASVEAAYTKHLGYVVEERGIVGADCARCWGAPAIANAKYVALAPASGEPTWLRFVEQQHGEGFRALTTTGWNAAEIIVRDVDSLAPRLEGSPFRKVVDPHPLDSVPDIHAMQVIGPAGEMLYLTSALRPMPERDMPQAQSEVDRCFIAVLGGTDLQAMLDFYLGTFGNAPGPVHAARVRAVSSANNLPADTRYDLATIRLGQGSKIEADCYPPFAPARPRAPGGLPFGMAMVGFECSDLDLVRHLLVAVPRTLESGPFRGRRTATLRGAAGEWIELIETGAGAQ